MMRTVSSVMKSDAKCAGFVKVIPPVDLLELAGFGGGSPGGVAFELSVPVVIDPVKYPGE